MKLRGILALGALLAIASFAVMSTTSSAQESDGLHGILSANVESYAARIEYDIPLPVGTGTIGQVTGEVRASAAGENAKGLAASPSALDPVVGGKYSDPRGTGHAENRYPQTECFYPGALVDTAFVFPTDERAETSGAPALGYAAARCSAGPLVDLHSRLGGDDTVVAAPGLTAAASASDALARPDKGVLTASAASHASSVSILDGAIKVGGIVARGESHITGLPGGGASSATVALTDIDVSGVVFSVNSASVDGRDVVQLTIAGQTVPADSAAALAVVHAANSALSPTGCSLAVLGSPDHYPQGFLFGRPEPVVGVADDGNGAASYRGGVLVTCNIPKSISEPSTFNPQRAQILLGFAYTGTALAPGDDSFSIGGFDTGDLLGGPLSGTVESSLPLTITTPAADVSQTAAAPAPAREETAASERVAAPATILPKHLSSSMKWALGLLSLVAWIPLTHFGARRLRHALFDGADQ